MLATISALGFANAGAGTVDEDTVPAETDTADDDKMLTATLLVLGTVACPLLTVDSAEEDRSLKGRRAPLTVRSNSCPDITTYFCLPSFVGADFWLSVRQ